MASATARLRGLRAPQRDRSLAELRDEAVGKRYIVTGANGGIGREIALGLVVSGAETVVLACRNLDRAADAQAEVSRRGAVGPEHLPILKLDLADLGAVRSAAAELADLGPFDGLINNAGLVLSERETSVDGYELTLATNHLGPYLLTRLLLDKGLRDSARVVNLASAAHWGAVTGFRFDDPFAERRYSGWGQYCRSKLANILFTRALAGRLVGTARVTNAVHPGVVRSEFGRDGDITGITGKVMTVGNPLQISPARGADTVLYCALAPELAEVSGQYFVRRHPGRVAPWARRADDEQRLWELSAHWTGLAV